MADNQLRAELIRKGLLKPTETEVKATKPRDMRMFDDRPIPLKHKKPGDGRSKSSQFGRR